ncbi:MAG: DUF3964 family protein [Clostridia bacterium]|nr:DUF3964 family protein [Clostridia bacterium]
MTGLECNLIEGGSKGLPAFRRKSLGNDAYEFCVLDGLGYCEHRVVAVSHSFIFRLILGVFGIGDNTVIILKVAVFFLRGRTERGGNKYCTLFKEERGCNRFFVDLSGIEIYSVGIKEHIVEVGYYTVHFFRLEYDFGQAVLTLFAYGVIKRPEIRIDAGAVSVRKTVEVTLVTLVVSVVDVNVLNHFLKLIEGPLTVKHEPVNVAKLVGGGKILVEYHTVGLRDCGVIKVGYCNRTVIAYRKVSFVCGSPPGLVKVYVLYIVPVEEELFQNELSRIERHIHKKVEFVGGCEYRLGNVVGNLGKCA